MGSELVLGVEQVEGKPRGADLPFVAEDGPFSRHL
jgi:hypothetical protein